MLVWNEPETPLRIANARAVLNAVFFSKPRLLPKSSNAVLGAYLRERWPTLYPGDVLTMAFRDADSLANVREAFMREASQYLKSYGLIGEVEDAVRFTESLEFMVTGGAGPHVDTHNSAWNLSLFLVYVLEAHQVDLLFPNLAIRVPLFPGQLVVFDPGQPHMVVPRNSSKFTQKSIPRGCRQSFIAGTLCPSKALWGELGVCTDPEKLAVTANLTNIQQAKLHRNTGMLFKH